MVVVVVVVVVVAVVAVAVHGLQSSVMAVAEDMLVGFHNEPWTSRSLQPNVWPGNRAMPAA